MSDVKMAAQESVSMLLRRLHAVEAERDAAMKWLRFCLNECDDSPEWNFGTAAAEEMKAFLVAIDAARSKT